MINRKGSENMHEEKLKQQIEMFEKLQQKLNAYEIDEIIKLSSVIIDLAYKYDEMYGDCKD